MNFETIFGSIVEMIENLISQIMEVILGLFVGFLVVPELFYACRMAVTIFAPTVLSRMPGAAAEVCLSMM